MDEVPQAHEGNAKGADIMPDPKRNKPAELTEDQLTGVTGGETVTPLVQPMYFKYCAADQTHVYPGIFDACPTCGCKEFILEGEQK